MASQIILKNGQDQEFSITHPDNVGAVRIKSNEIATKLELAAKVALADFIGTNVNLAGNGYQKLPSGLIIQWGSNNAGSSYIYYNLPITFPTAGVVALSSHPGESYNVCNIKLTTKQIGLKSMSTIQNWIAIGY